MTKTARTEGNWRVGINGYVIQDRRGEVNLGAAFSSTVGAEAGLANAKVMALGPELLALAKQVAKGEITDAMVTRAKEMISRAEG